MSANETPITADAIKEIERLTKEAARAEIIIPPGPPGEMVILQPDGKAQFEKLGIGWHNETLCDDSAFQSFVMNRTGGGTPTITNPQSEVWVSRERAVFIYDNTDRRDRASLTFIVSEPFRWLQKSSSKSMSQSEIIRTLRVIFANCLPIDSSLISSLRSLRFDSSASANASVNHCNESLGRHIMNTVTGEIEIPEVLSLQLQVFENAVKGMRFNVLVALEIIPSEQRFLLTPLPGELTRAMDGAVNGMTASIVHPSVFFGECPMPALN